MGIGVTGNNIPERYLDRFNARVTQELFERDCERWIEKEMSDD